MQQNKQVQTTKQHFGGAGRPARRRLVGRCPGCDTTGSVVIETLLAIVQSFGIVRFSNNIRLLVLFDLRCHVATYSLFPMI